MTPEQEALVDRIRALLDGEADVREVSMFGGRAFMVNGKMAVSVGKDGTLLVRVAAEDHTEILARPGASQAMMGPDRDMGPGWVNVDADALADDGAAAWLATALEYNRSVTG